MPKYISVPAGKDSAVMINTDLITMMRNVSDGKCRVYFSETHNVVVDVTAEAMRDLALMPQKDYR